MKKRLLSLALCLALCLGAFDAPSTTQTAEARKALQHGRLRDFTGTANRAEKRL